MPRHGSIVFGGRIFDGVLFPALWLGLVWMARVFCLRLHLPLAVFKVVVPILLSLLVIRLTVRVMRVAFPKSGLVRAVEKTVSWMAWAGVVLWITGVLPSFIDALDDVHWKMGSSTMSLATILEGAIVAGVVLMVTLWVSAAIETQAAQGRGRASSCRGARRRPTSCARCWCSSACCWRCRRWASTSPRCRCWAARSASAWAWACRSSRPTT